jgi:hypothetical protein
MLYSSLFIFIALACSLGLYIEVSNQDVSDFIAENQSATFAYLIE